MDAHKSVRACIVCHLCPLAVADIHIVLGADHQHLIAPAFQLCLQFQRHLQRQLVFCQTTGLAGGAARHLGLRLGSPRANGLLLAVALGLMPGIYGHQMTVAAARRIAVLCRNGIPILHGSILTFCSFRAVFVSQCRLHRITVQLLI